MKRRLLKMLIEILLVGSVCSLGLGCTRGRTVLIPSQEPVQLAETVWAYVYYCRDGRKIRSDERIELKEGLWVLSDDEDK